ncbi:MAG TPA: xanthine dehydrogenase family protein molybdopterin-binding subunit [Anaerolineales bacterium]|nr:xanthine dehydrogenase family protein molybdopterin-binding subunit [Anaerolineales bacterium]
MAIGESVPMLDSVARVTGAVDYMVNLRLPNMLFGKIVRSQSPHARLLKVDTSNALQVPGVVAVLTGVDLGTNAFYGVAIKDQGVVAMDRVRYVGEPIAAIAAESLEAAEEAALLIDIEYSEMPSVFDAQEAIQASAPTLHEKFPNNIFKHAKLRYGDIEAAFDEADEIFEDTFTSPVAQQASLEPHASAAQWDGVHLTMWTGSQAPFMVRKALSEIFDIAPEAVRVIVPPLGGGYGGKGHIRIEPLVAAMARKTNGRPVEFILSRAEEFVTVTKHAASITLKTGVKRDGTFTARQVTIYWNGGAYADASPLLVPAGMVRSVGPYRISAVHVDSYGVYTNLPPAGAYRGAMSSQTTWAYESQMDIIAHKMGWDPLEFRMKNLFVSGDRFATGEELHEVHFVECLDSAAKGLSSPPSPRPPLPASSPDFVLRSARIGGGRSRRGRGYGVMMKSTVATSKSQARLKLMDDGTVTLYTSTVEMGQGGHTTMAQITAESLGAPLSAIKIVGPDTAVTPFDSTTSASRSTSMMGNAVIAACGSMKKKLFELSTPLLEVPPDQLRTENGFVVADEASISFADILKRTSLETLEEGGEYSTSLGIDPETGRGVASPHWHQGAGAVEVEVDTETGRVTILRYSAASFAGRVVNPRLAQLQNDGNVIFGLGPTLMEEIAYDGGQATNPNLADYAIPSIRDIPVELISTCIESERGEMHGIGEMTLPPVAPAVANAIEDAVGVRIKDLPITAEKVLRALREKSEQ